MVIAFQITLIIYILISTVFAFAGESKELKLNASILSVVGIMAFIISSIYL